MRANHPAHLTHVLALLVVGALAACGGKKAPAHPVSDDPVLGMQDLRDRACACKDAACASAVGDQLNQFAAAHQDTKLDQAQGQAVDAAIADLDRCLGAWADQPEDERMSAPNN